MPSTKASMTLLALALVFPSYAVAADFASTRIAVTATGEGSDVILLSGLGSSPQIWQQLIADVDGHRYHLVQVNGFAGTAAGDNAQGELLVPLAGEIARYIDTQGIDDAALIGHSMGGVLALMVTAQNTGAVSRVMTVDTPAFLAETMGATAETVAPIAEAVRAQTLALDDAAYAAQQAGFAASSVRSEAGRALVAADLLASDRAVVTQATYELMLADLRDELATLRVPVTAAFALPAAAPLTPAQIEAFYASQYSGVAELTLAFVADAGHFLMLDQPAPFAAIAETFLD